MRKSLFLAAVACLTSGAPAVAQNSIPGLENFTLEGPQPTPPASPKPMVTPPPPAPPPSPTPPAAVATPSGRTTPAPRATAPPIVAPTATPTPDETVAPVALPTPIPTEVTPAVPTEPAAAAVPTPWSLWAALAGLMVAGITGFLWWRGRQRRLAQANENAVAVAAPARPARTTDWTAPPAAPAAVPAPPPPSPPSPPAATRGKPGGLITTMLKPEVRIGLRPVRGGVDSLRATLEYELQLINTGRGVARAVAVEAWLLSAGHETAADLQEFFASPPGELMLPPFDLPATAAIDLAGMALLPREALATITVGERRMFVPVLAARARFADGRGVETVLTEAFLVGIERDGQARLAPLPLDRGSRTHDRLAARPYQR